LFKIPADFSTQCSDAYLVLSGRVILTIVAIPSFLYMQMINTLLIKHNKAPYTISDLSSEYWGGGVSCPPDLAFPSPRANSTLQMHSLFGYSQSLFWANTRSCNA